MRKSPLNIPQDEELQNKVVRDIMTFFCRDVSRNVIGNCRNERGDDYVVGWGNIWDKEAKPSKPHRWTAHAQSGRRLMLPRTRRSMLSLD